MLCSVPDTTLNLSYESLTSREAKQAILSLAVTNPAAYAEIMAGTQLPPSEEQLEVETNLFSEVTEMEGDLNHTVEEVSAALLAASSAPEAAEPLVPVPDFDDQLEPDEDSTVIPLPSTVRATTRSGRTTRLSSRYRGSDWMCH
jgi:hypothetical protein